MTEKEMSKEESAIWDEIMAAEHAMQSAVKTYIDHGDNSATPKQLRTGLNASMSNQGAVVALLVEKGVFTPLEYAQFCLKFAEKEAEDAAQCARKATGNDNLYFA